MRMRNFLACPRAVPTEMGRSERPGAAPIVEKWKPPIPPAMGINSMLPFAQSNCLMVGVGLRHVSGRSRA
jgi:hypothetical protein